MKKIGMVIAMQREVIPFLQAENLVVKCEESYGFDVMRFSINGNDIICVQSGIGEIHAAAATQLLICDYKVDMIVNCGVCGSLCDLGLKKVVAVKGVVHYDYDLSPIDDVEVGRYPDQPSAVIDTDEESRKIVKEVFPEIREVICASADKFVADETVKERLHKTYGAEICEMESAGVLLTALHSSVPCLIIKAISDGKGGADDYKQTVDAAAKACVEVVIKLCEHK